MIKKIFLLLSILLVSSAQIAPSQQKEKRFVMSGGTFDTEIEVIITRDISAVAQYARFATGDPTITTENFKARGLTIVSPEVATIMWLPEIPRTPEQFSVANHELFHAAKSILDWARVPLDNSSEEVYAFMMGHLSKQFYQNINNEN